MSGLSLTLTTYNTYVTAVKLLLFLFFSSPKFLTVAISTPVDYTVPGKLHFNVCQLTLSTWRPKGE